MGSLIIGILVMVFFINKYDKWDTRDDPKGDITINEIRDMFEENSDKEQYK